MSSQERRWDLNAFRRQRQAYLSAAYSAEPRPLKLRREPKSYFHKPVSERVKTDPLLPRLKFLERPDP
jgi:hypothetical protein